MENLEMVARVSETIKKDFYGLGENEIEALFDKFQGDKKAMSFIEFYNRTVLDKKKIRFGEFKSRWAIQGMTRESYSFFDDNYDSLKDEIIHKKDIRSFFEKYCTKQRREGSFCSKLFHTFLPAEFPPVDNPIRKRFCLNNDEFITDVLIIKKAYDSVIKKDKAIIERIRNVLSKDKFNYLRANELSDFRILDIFYWFSLNR